MGMGTETALRPKIFVESSVISVLVETRPKDLLLLSRQVYTRAWWRKRSAFDLFASKAVREEAATGDGRKAAKRLVILRTMTPLDIRGTPQLIASELLQTRILPQKAQVDVLHWATASFYRMDYLLTWNLKHLANAQIQQQIFRWADKAKYNTPAVTTPEQLLRSLYGP
jgi:hypothetical protein